MDDVVCVFCKDTGFDLQGLKNHIYYHCEGFDKTPGFIEVVLAESVVQKSSDDWVWLKDGIWQSMTVEEQIAWTERN